MKKSLMFFVSLIALTGWGATVGDLTRSDDVVLTADWTATNAAQDLLIANNASSLVAYKSDSNLVGRADSDWTNVSVYSEANKEGLKTYSSGLSILGPITTNGTDNGTDSTAIPSEKPFVIVSYGQSNTGNVSGEPSTRYGDGEIANTYRFYDSLGFKQGAVSFDAPASTFGPNYATADRLRDVIPTNRPIWLIRLGHGGVPIDYFLPDADYQTFPHATSGQGTNFTSFTYMTNHLNFAFTNNGYAVEDAWIDAVCFSHGESLAGSAYNTKDLYRSAEEEIRDYLRNMYNTNMLWLTSGLGPGGGANTYDDASRYSDVAKRELCDRDSLSEYIYMKDALTGWWSDAGMTVSDVHYTIEWVERHGYRAAAAAAKHLPSVSLPESIAASEVTVLDDLTVKNGTLSIPGHSDVAASLSSPLDNLLLGRVSNIKDLSAWESTLYGSGFRTTYNQATTITTLSTANSASILADGDNRHGLGAFTDTVDFSTRVDFTVRFEIPTHTANGSGRMLIGNKAISTNELAGVGLGFVVDDLDLKIQSYDTGFNESSTLATLTEDNVYTLHIMSDGAGAMTWRLLDWSTQTISTGTLTGGPTTNTTLSRFVFIVENFADAASQSLQIYDIVVAVGL